MKTVMRVLLLTTLAASALAAPVAPVGAHSDTGVLGTEVTPGTAPLTANVRALLEYSNDRHPVPGAMVTASASSPDGQTVPATVLGDRGQGLYEGVLTMPVAGSWTVTVTAEDPSASATAAVAVSATASPSVAPTASPPGSGPTDDPGGLQTSSDATDRSDGGDGNDDGGSSGLVVAALVLVLAGAAATAFVLVRRRR